jgi:hypothetical protein
MQILNQEVVRQPAEQGCPSPAPVHRPTLGPHGIRHDEKVLRREELSASGLPDLITTMVVPVICGWSNGTHRVSGGNRLGLVFLCL